MKICLDSNQKVFSQLRLHLHPLQNQETIASKPGKDTLNHKAKATLRPKSATPESLPTNTKELKKMETVKSRQLAKRTWYEQYDQLISHIPESASNAKSKIIKLFKLKIDNNKPKDIAGAFDGAGTL